MPFFALCCVHLSLVYPYLNEILTDCMGCFTLDGARLMLWSQGPQTQAGTHSSQRPHCSSVFHDLLSGWCHVSLQSIIKKSFRDWNWQQLAIKLHETLFAFPWWDHTRHDVNKSQLIFRLAVGISFKLIQCTNYSKISLDLSAWYVLSIWKYYLPIDDSPSVARELRPSVEVIEL